MVLYRYLRGGLGFGGISDFSTRMYMYTSDWRPTRYDASCPVCVCVPVYVPAPVPVYVAVYVYVPVCVPVYVAAL
jgi:hypothetical protein